MLPFMNCSWWPVNPLSANQTKWSKTLNLLLWLFRSSPSEIFWGKGILKIRNRFTGEHPCRNAISIKLLCSFIEITFRHGCSPINLLHIFKYLFLKTSLEGCFWLFLVVQAYSSIVVLLKSIINWYRLFFDCLFYDSNVSKSLSFHLTHLFSELV